MRVYRSFSPIMIILALGAFLLLFHLDHRPFWQDEAETAVLAKHVLQYGVPRAYDGVNIISQEAGARIWPQLFMALVALAANLCGRGGVSPRRSHHLRRPPPFALLGLGCIFLVYHLVRHNFGDRAWALMAAALLACSVPFLLYARQCRYYSLGAFLTLVSLYAFREKWQSKTFPASPSVSLFGTVVLCELSPFLQFCRRRFIGGGLLYYAEMPLARSLTLILAVVVIILPGLFFFRINQQAAMVSLEAILANLQTYLGNFFQFMFPLPLALYLGWRWGRLLWTRTGLAAAPQEKFIFFLSLVVLGNILLLTPAPQGEMRYLIHLYPLCAIIMGWIVCQAWRYQKFSGVLLAVLLLGTNWLNILPMDWLRLMNRPFHNDHYMLTYPNIPLKLYLAELSSPYPDVNQSLIQFFQTHARPGDTILTTYGDLPLMFYTSCQVLGGLQGHIPLTRPPQWLVLRWYPRWNRDHDLNESEVLIRQLLANSRDYQRVVLPGEDEIFGNQPDPFFHHFLPPVESLSPITIYEKKSPSRPQA